MRDKIDAAIFETLKIAPPYQSETSLNDMGCDSLDAIEIVMSLEDIFDLEIGDDEWADARTVGDIYNLVERLANAN
jgi:acyl carrier protein